MSMRAEVRAVIGYLAIVAVVFITAYVVLGVREMGLYVLVMLLNLPASVAVVPYMESFWLAREWSLGSALYAWTTQLACMTVNAVLVGALAFVVTRTWRSNRRRAAPPA